MTYGDGGQHRPSSDGSTCLGCGDGWRCKPVEASCATAGYDAYAWTERLITKPEDIPAGSLVYYDMGERGHDQHGAYEVVRLSRWQRIKRYLLNSPDVDANGERIESGW